jgi:hypothetical protein
VQLKQLELVVLAQQAVRYERGTRIDLDRGFGVEGRHQVHVVLQGRGQAGDAGEAENAVGGFTAGLGVVAVQPVQAGAGVGVHDHQRCFFFRQVFEGRNQHGVLEHIGVVAGVKGVAVAEHVAMVTRRQGPQLR